MGDLSCFNSTFPKDIHYQINPDHRMNENGRTLITLCQSCNLVPVNHVIYKDVMCNSDLTYRQGNSWISQLDWVLCKTDVLDLIVDFTINRSLVLSSDHAIISFKLGPFSPVPAEISARANLLGESWVTPHNPMKSVAYQSIDINNFTRSLPPVDEFWNMNMPVNDLNAKITETLYNLCKESKLPNSNTRACNPRISNSNNRWHQILTNKDSRSLWTSINWNGSFDRPPDELTRPSDEAFCAHYQQLLNPGVQIQVYLPSVFKYMPILDDDITPLEVHTNVKKLKTNKTAGCNGLPPGVLKHVNQDWIILLTHLFNMVFSSDYPSDWNSLKVFNIYKKGSQLDTANYRGISIMSALSKVYDLILASRFTKWYSPLPEQAGAQPSRGCEEQILVVKLLIDIARKCNFVLYISFVDYTKAYDLVDRSKLFKMLDSKGCGTKFLLALQASMQSSIGVIGQSTFSATSGVKQGAPTSCPLFTCFIDETVKALKQTGPDSWLEDLHCLLLMDDTVIFASSRDKLKEKLCALKRCTDLLGMVIHPNKSKFISVIANDTEPVKIDDVSINFTTEYTYLGTKISNSTCAAQARSHVSSKANHVLQFNSFLSKNSDAPYSVKKTVMNSAVNSALFYSSESWMTSDLRFAESHI